MHHKSKKPIEILDENKNVIGSIQRYLKNTKEKIIDVISLYELTIINIIARDSEKNIRANIKGNFTWFSRPKWDMEFEHQGSKQQCVIKNTSTLNVHLLKELQYKINNQQYKIKVSGSNTLFYADSLIIAKVLPADKKILTDKYIFEITDSTENIFVIVSLFYLFINFD